MILILTCRWRGVIPNIYWQQLLLSSTCLFHRSWCYNQKLYQIILNYWQLSMIEISFLNCLCFVNKFQKTSAKKIWIYFPNTVIQYFCVLFMMSSKQYIFISYRICIYRAFTAFWENRHLYKTSLVLYKSMFK